MKAIHPSLYQLLKERHEEKLIKLSDINRIEIGISDSNRYNAELPITVILQNGKKLKQVISRKSLSELGNETGVILIDSLDTKLFNEKVELSTRQAKMAELLGSANIDTLDLTEIDIILVDDKTLMLRAIDLSILYFGTVLIRQRN